MAWDDIIGQELAKKIFTAHLASGRVPNAYLLVGPDGVGKRRLALDLAKALNCTESQHKPCDACRTCTQIARGIHPDVHLIVPGGASDQVKIDQIRQIISRIALLPFNAAFQVVIVEAAERFTEEAGNSLLKALEEPSPHTRFCLTTSRLADCLPTIVSRCQLIRCQPLLPSLVQRIVREQCGCDAKTAQTVACLARGSASRAIELAQRWTGYQQTLARLSSTDPLAWIEPSPTPETRQEVTEVLDAMMAWLRDVAVAAVGDPASIAHAAHREIVRQQASAMDLDRCLETAFELLTLRESIDQFVSPRLIASVAREKWLSLVSR